MLNDFRLDFSTRLLNKSGSNRGIFNPFNFDLYTNPTQPDLFNSPSDYNYNFFPLVGLLKVSITHNTRYWAPLQKTYASQSLKLAKTYTLPRD